MLSDTTRLNGLIDNLLSANRVEQKHWRLDLQTIDFSTFVEKYFRSRQFTLPKAGKLTMEINPGIRAAIDREAMETVLRNLLENAVLYSDKSPQVNVSLSTEGNNCCLAITDHGRGIDSYEQKKIFKMFYRIRRKDENIRGTGLGLFIVHATVRRHQGRVKVESMGKDQGTTFKIYLPLVQQSEIAETS